MWKWKPANATVTHFEVLPRNFTRTHSKSPQHGFMLSHFPVRIYNQAGSRSKANNPTGLWGPAITAPVRNTTQTQRSIPRGSCRCRTAGGCHHVNKPRPRRLVKNGLCFVPPALVWPVDREPGLLLCFERRAVWVRINPGLPLTSAEADELLSTSRLGALRAESLQQWLADKMTDRQRYDESNGGVRVSVRVCVQGGGGVQKNQAFLPVEIFFFDPVSLQSQPSSASCHICFPAKHCASPPASATVLHS